MAELTKREWAEAHRNCLVQRDKEIAKVTLEIMERFEHDLEFIRKQWTAAPSDRSNENSKGTPPNENSNKTPPSHEI